MNPDPDVEMVRRGLLSTASDADAIDASAALSRISSRLEELKAALETATTHLDRDHRDFAHLRAIKEAVRAFARVPKLPTKGNEAAFREAWRTLRTALERRE